MEEQELAPDSSRFRVNRNLINSVEKQDQDLELQQLDIAVYDHSILEQGIIEQVKDALKEDQSEEEEGEIRDDEPDESAKLNTNPSDYARSTAGSSSFDSLSILEKYLKKQSELASKKKVSVNKSKQQKHFPISPAAVIPKDDASVNNNLQLSQGPRAEKSQPVKRKKKHESHHKSKKKKNVDEEADDNESESNDSSGSEYNPLEDDVSDDDNFSPKGTKNKAASDRNKKRQSSDESESSWADSEDDEYSRKRKSKKELDDGNIDIYIRRTKHLDKLDRNNYVSIDSHFRLPTYIWKKLFAYQQEGVRWLWSLHTESYGGVLGDEMGLGKTIQMISFLAGLHYSDERDVELNCHGLGPTIIICPTTIMHQWVREFHAWYPHIRVAILHESGTFTGKSRKQLINSITRKTVGVLVTSYSGVIQNKDAILACQWHYVILDEGHKIRNPESQITSLCKNFDTSHRIILSGSPMQNNLKELWSLFDFVVPGKLGSLNIFTSSFVSPIVQGGYANASKQQVLTAFKCATALRDTIKPFLLRRSKVEVDIQLPGKKEQVLFCKLSEQQREAYIAFLRTLDVDYVQNNKGFLFQALDILRKICNHPDLYTSNFNANFVLRDTMFGPEKGQEDDYGYWKRSGKMIVLINLLKHWYKIGGQKVLIFSQGKKMMVILENFIKRSGYKYLKLDGSVSIGARQPLIDKFNKDASYFIMLLTTRVGGLGVNLTGANKVIIFDPDWNPATDVQARERAWRIGQSKDVNIYRLLTTGTIEEKIYHRQIYKEFLSNKILKNPKQRRFFKSNDLLELFTLNETVSGGTSETAAIFAGTGSEIKYDPKFSAKTNLKKTPVIPEIVFSKEKLEEMRRIAQEKCKKIAALTGINNQNGKTNSSTKINDTNEEIYGPDGNLKIVPNSDVDRNSNRMSFGSDKNMAVDDDRGTSDNSMGASSAFKSASVSRSDVPGHSSTSVQEESEQGQHGSDDDSEYEMSFADILNLNRKKETAGRSDGGKSQSVPEIDSKVRFIDAERDVKEKSKKKFKKKDKPSKKSKFATFEGEVVPHLVKCRKVKKKKEDKKKAKQHDDYILHKLLKKSGIDTAMKHDTIMEEGPNDFAVVEEEASRVADEAVKSIQQSYNRNRNSDMQCKNPIMQEIINKFKERNLETFNCGPQARTLLVDLISYLNSLGGTASTDQVVDNFKEKVDSGKSPIFKKLLNNIATFYRAPDSKGYWTVKDEFKSLLV